MSDKTVVLLSDGHYIFRRPRYGWDYSGTPTHIILENGNEIEFNKDATPFSVKSKPVKLVRRQKEEISVGYGDLSVEEYDKKRAEFEDQGWMDDDDYELNFDDIDVEYEYKKFLRDHPLKVEEKEIEVPLEFEIFEMGTTEEKYIKPISNMDVEKTNFAYYLEIPPNDLMERFRSHFDEKFEFWQYGNKVKDLGQYRNFDVELEYDVRFKSLGETRVDGKEILIVRRVGSLENLIARRDATLKQVDDLAKRIKSRFTAPSEQTVADLIKILKSIQSQARGISPMQKSRGAKETLMRQISSAITKLESE